MSSIAFITLGVPGTTAASTFYTSAFELGDTVRVRQAEEPTRGFRISGDAGSFTDPDGFVWQSVSS
jgi:hypothetical protein